MDVLYRGYATKVVPNGFSWTTFFFGIFPALFRGDMFHCMLMFVTSVCTLGLSWLVWPFVYNGMYRNRLMSNGWSTTPTSPGSGGSGSGGGNGGHDPKKIPVYHNETLFSAGYDRSAPQFDILYDRSEMPPPRASNANEDRMQERAIPPRVTRPVTPTIAPPVRKTFGRKIS